MDTSSTGQTTQAAEHLRRAGEPNQCLFIEYVPPYLNESTPLRTLRSAGLPLPGQKEPPDDRHQMPRSVTDWFEVRLRKAIAVIVHVHKASGKLRKILKSFDYTNLSSMRLEIISSKIKSLSKQRPQVLSSNKKYVEIPIEHHICAICSLTSTTSAQDLQ